MEKLPSLSIFFPFWNEEENIAKVAQNALKLADSLAWKWEIILIDDGSSDKTLQIAQEIAKKEKYIKVLTHQPNRGYGAALKEGFAASQYDYVVFTDGDGQFDFNEVRNFIAKIRDYDLVIGYRKKRKDALGRHLLMNLLKIWDFVLFGIHFKDIDCGFKMFRKEALEKILPLRSEGAMITTEILVKAKKKNLRIFEIPVSHFQRRLGDQTGGNLFVVARAVLESFILFLDIKNGRF